MTNSPDFGSTATRAGEFASYAGSNDDVAGRSFVHGDLLESFVMDQGGPKDGRAENMLGRRAQHDSLIGRLCEDEGYGQRMLRKAYGWPPKGPWWTCRCSEPPFGRSSCPRPVAVLPLSRLRSPLDQSQDGHPDGVAWPSEVFQI
jgi:hypothetical protein